MHEFYIVLFDTNLQHHWWLDDL